MIELRNVTKKYGSFVAVQDVSFTARNGSVFGLVGHNGAGKTTLLKTIAGVYLPDEGSVTVDGLSVHGGGLGSRHSPFVVADEPYFLPQATPDIMRAFYRGYYPAWSDTAYRRLLDLFGLDFKARIGGFSKGMQRQVVLVLALATGSRCLLLDESFDGLDLGRRNLFKRLFRRYAAERDAVIILSSHNLRELEDAVDRIGMIEGRRLAFDLTVEEMHRRYRKYRVRGCRAGGDGARPEDAGALGTAARAPRRTDAGRVRELLAGSPAVHWVRCEGEECAFLVDTWAGDVAAQLTAAGVSSLEVLEATLEEIFLDEEEVNPIGLEGIFD